MLVIAGNPTYGDAERAFLAAPSAAGSTTQVLKSTTNLSVNETIVLGEVGTETAEIIRIVSIDSNTTMTTTATKFGHSTDEPIYESRFTKIRIYRAASVSGSYSLINTVAIQVDNPHGQTTYDDTSGTQANYYRVSYYNDISTLESSLSDPIPGTGYSRSSVSYLIDAVLEEANDKQEQITTRAEIIRWVNDCNIDVHSRKTRKIWEWWKTSDQLSLTADDDTIALSGLTKDFDKLDRLEYTYDDGDEVYDLRYLPPFDFARQTRDTTAQSSNKLAKFTLDFTNDNLLVTPKPVDTQVNKLRLYYGFLPTVVDSEGDELEIPDFNVYFNYCMYRFFKKKDDKRRDTARADYELAVRGLARFQRREVGQPMSMDYRKGGVRGFYKY